MTAQLSEAADLRAHVFGLLYAITGTMPSGAVLADHDQLQAAVLDAVQLAAATKRQCDEFKTAVTELCRQRDERNAETQQPHTDTAHQPGEHLAGTIADNPAVLPPGTWLAGEGVYALRWFTHPEADYEERPWIVFGPWGIDADGLDHDRVRGWTVQACTPSFPTWAPQPVDVSDIPPHEPLPRRVSGAALAAETEPARPTASATQEDTR
jgi:hypothetical protein